MEEVDFYTQKFNEVHYELRFKAQTYSPGCRICRRKDTIESGFNDRVVDQLVNSFVRRVLKVIKMREGWIEDEDPVLDIVPDLINYH